ncbi:hypothetical protein HDV00_010130 [Rhizophlyctis rosea]|nr:hypothetical protein HDV00_010130 [Rhizophlyctis rosea]
MSKHRLNEARNLSQTPGLNHIAAPSPPRNVGGRFQKHTRKLELYQKRIKEQTQLVSAPCESSEDLRNRAKETQTQMVENEARVAELEDTIAGAIACASVRILQRAA